MSAGHTIPAAEVPQKWGCERRVKRRALEEALEAGP